MRLGRRKRCRLAKYRDGPAVPPLYEVSPAERDDDRRRDRREFDDEQLTPIEAWMRDTLRGREEYGGP